MKKTILTLLTSWLVVCNLLAQENKDTITWSLNVEDVVVTATYAPTDSRNAIHLIRVLDQKDIQRLQARNLEQLLVTDVNVRIEQDAQLGSVAKLSGLDGQNVKIMIDGVPVIGRLNGNIDLSQIQLYDVERVEVVEGPLAVNYGTDALAGVINIITKKSQINKYQLQLDMSMEDKGEQTASLGGGVRLNEKLLLRGQFGMDEFKGFDSDTTRYTVWNPKEQVYTNASLRYTLSENHDLRYSFKWFNEKVTNLGDVRRPVFKPYAFDERYITERVDHSIHYEGRIGEKLYLNSFLAYNSFLRQKDYWRTDFETGEILNIEDQQDTSKINSWHFRTSFATQDQDAPVEFMVGLDNRFEDFIGDRIQGPGSDGERYANILDNAVFASAKYKVLKDKLIVEAGLRYALNNRFTTPLLPSVNTRYELNDQWTFRGSYGKGFRSPDIKELFFSFIDVNHFILGNDRLQPETSNNFQGGFTYYRYHKDQEVTMGFHAFYNHLNDKIELFEYVDGIDGPTPASSDTITNNYTYFNISEYRTKGVSARFGYDRHTWRLRMNYGLIGHYNVGHEDLENVSPYSYTNELSFDGRYMVPKILVDFQMTVRFYDRQISFYPDVDQDGNEVVGKRVQDGFTTMDMSLGRSFLDGNLRVTTGIRNLLDITSTTIKRDNSAIGNHNTGISQKLVSTGRRWFVGLNYNLGWGK